MPVILGHAEDTGFYLMDRWGTPLSACWFETIEDVIDYCNEQGFDLFEREED